MSIKNTIKEAVIGIGALLIFMFVIGAMLGYQDHAENTPNKPVMDKLDSMCLDHAGTYEYKRGWGGRYDFSVLCTDGEVFYFNK